MRILAVDTALGACSVAILDDDTPLARDFAVMARGHAEALAPMVEAVMKKAACEFASIERLAVTTGPGTLPSGKSSVATIACIQVVPHLGGVQTKMSPGRWTKCRQRRVSKMWLRYSRVGSRLAVGSRMRGG